jgi:heme oxygenase
MTSTLTETPFDLAAFIRASSSEQHRGTEQRTFISDLMGGALSLADYTRYLAQYAWLYEVLEQAVLRVDLDSVPGLAALFDPTLARMASIESDLGALGAADWREAHPPLAATAAYAEHLRTLGAADGVRVLAHHYTRYLGDLSGGQAIAALVARHYAATPEQLSFYRFDGIDSVVRYKRGYRDALNALALSSDDIDLLVREVDASFTFNGSLFDALLD